MEIAIAELQKSIEKIYNCAAKWVETTPVKEIFQDQIVWDGAVQIFDLQGHPDATRCYAWSYGFEDSNMRKIFAVLHKGVVNSPLAAVRAAIVAEHRQGTP